MLHWGGDIEIEVSNLSSSLESGVLDTVGWRGQRKLNMIQMLSGGAGYETKGR